MPLKLPELLCPAGDENALRAAIDYGANAVYLGYKAFGARASAVNFDDEVLQRAVCYAHLHHARVHVTVNTLVKPGELEGVHEALTAIDAAGADAVIVQDLGVAEMVRRDFPRLHLHASTQMALCNADGARMAQGLGFDRVVLARECSLEDIRGVVSTGIETEIFAHGALCTAVSGRCLMSSMSGGRSGNRGRCAQPCRQCFQMDDQEGALLSLRDLCTLDDLPVLCEAGVASLKIEGRLKSAEYVAVVTQVYRRALDQIAMGTFRFSKAEKEKLMQIFNRGGFTRGHALDAEDADLITPDRVSHEGLPIGEILSVKRDLAQLRVERDLHDGDSLQLRGKVDADMRYSGHDVPAGGTATLRLRPGLTAEAGMKVARLTSAKQLEEVREHTAAPIPVSMMARFSLGQPMTLSMSDGETSIQVYGPVVEAAQKRASTAFDAKKQLEKLGGTPFLLSDGCLQILVDDNVFLPVSALNALRRDAVEKLTEARIAAFASPDISKPAAPALQRPQHMISQDTLAVVFSDPDVAEQLQDAGANLLIYEPRTCTPEALENALNALPEGGWLRLPPQLTQELQGTITQLVHRYAGKLGGVVAESVAQLDLALPVPLLAGEGIPVGNPLAMNTVHAKGACGFVLWPEWNYAEQQALEPFSLPSLLKVYGRERLMLLNHCPERVRLGLSSNRAACRLCRTESMVCGKEHAGMTDRKGYRFPLLRTQFPHGCEITVLGALPTDLRQHDSNRLQLGAGMLLVFTTETPDEQLQLVRQFASLLRGDSIPAPAFPTTAGHWLRGVD